MSETEANSDLEGMSGLSLFFGEFTHQLDDKNRVTVPSDWRAMIGIPKRLHIAMSIEGNFLQATPARTIGEKLKLERLSLSDEIASRNHRSIAQRGQLFEWDAQGRVRLPEPMLNFARIKPKGKVGLIATLDGFQIWNEADCPYAAKVNTPADQVKSAMHSVGLK